MPRVATKFLVKEKTELIQNEMQSLKIIQHLFLTTFACVGYLRDLFSENCFTDYSIADMKLKQFKRGASNESDALLDWLEKGCFDALKKKYLKMAVFGIYLNPDNPTNMIETYTFKVSYPPIDGGLVESQMTNLSIEQNEKPLIQCSSTEDDFRKSVVKILRTICILTQTLKTLPIEKYLTMKLYYYDERTPSDYQPPYFKACPANELDAAFIEKPMKVDFGSALTPFHSINVKVQTISDTLNTQDYGRVSFKNTLPTESIIENLGNINVSSINPIEEKHQKVNHHPADQIPQSPFGNTIEIQDFPKSNGNTTKAVEGKHLNLTTAVLKSTAVRHDGSGGGGHEVENKGDHDDDDNNNNVAEKEKDAIVCVCGCNETDLDMIFCDQCMTWQHTVCAGYYSNKDKRIPQGDHICFNCLYSGKTKILSYLSNLSAWRRALSVVFHEGIQGVILFSRRLGLDLSRSKAIVERMIVEGFLIRLPKSEASVDQVKKGGTRNKYKYEVVKGNEIKKKIKVYFDIHLQNDPEFVKLLKDDETIRSKPITTSNRKKRASPENIIENNNNITSPLEKRLKVSVSYTKVKTMNDY